MAAEFRQTLADQSTIPALQHTDRFDHDRIPKVIEHWVAELEQFGIVKTMSSEAEQLQSGQAMSLAGMLKGALNNLGGDVATPTTKCLHDEQIRWVVIAGLFQQFQQPVSSLQLLTQASCHHQIGLNAMGLNQPMNHRPAPFGQHPKFFGEGSA